MTYFIGIDEAGRAAKRRASPLKYFIGIDEAGRGPLAGPVVVSGVRLHIRKRNPAMLRGIKDSKQLSAKDREEWYQFLTAHASISWAVASISSRVIDRVNIRRATDLGAHRVSKKLMTRGENIWILLDGGLRLPQHIQQEAIIKGDEKEPIIAAASIIAKVTRDRMMMRIHKQYPHYGFDRHKGYGTELHCRMIRRYGRSPLHRESFRMHLR